MPRRVVRKERGVFQKIVKSKGSERWLGSVAWSLRGKDRR